MKKIFPFLRNISGFGIGDSRSNLAKKNIWGSLIIKGLNIGIGLVLVPLVINYLNPTKYGIWITLSSVIGWFGFFDIGLGNGLRNKLTEAFAKGDRTSAKVYVSTTYAILAMVIAGVLLLFNVINPFLDWNSILNAEKDVVSSSELNILAIVVFSFFCLQFILKLVTTILMADQMPAKASIFDLIGRALTLIIIFVLIKTTEGSLLLLGFVMGFMPVLVLSLSSIWFYTGKYKDIRPSFYFVDLNKAKDLFSLGVKFFIIQIAAILLYQTNTIIITQLFGPEHVTPYYIAFQYFSVIMMVFSIVITPFWSAFTDAWVKKDLLWVKQIMNKLYKAWFILGLTGICMLIGSKLVYSMWIGDNVHISYTTSALVLIWVLMNAWNSIFSQFLNGVGKLKFQLYIGLSAAILNVPLGIIFGSKIGINGVLLANIIVSIVAVAVYPYQYKMIINNTAKGIWNE